MRTCVPSFEHHRDPVKALLRSMLTLFITEELLHTDRVKFSSIGGDGAAQKDDTIIYVATDCKVMIELMWRATTWEKMTVRNELQNVFHQIRREILGKIAKHP